MKVTMKEIAERLDISINAVSIALNDKPGVSDEMRLRILCTADEMGYINHKKAYLSVFSKSNICVMMLGSLSLIYFVYRRKRVLKK